MPDVANHQEYTELKGLLDSSPDADPAKLARARDALKRYEDQYLGGKNIAHDQSLLAPDTGPRPRGESYQPPARISQKQLAQMSMDNPQISDASMNTLAGQDAPVAPPSSIAKPPLRLISPAPQAPGMSDAELAQFAMDNPQVPDSAMLGLQGPSYRSQVTAHQMPTHVGGGTEVFPDAPLSKFVREIAPTLRASMDPLEFEAMLEQPQASQQYRNWIDQTYNERSDAALARGHSAKRIPAGLLDKSYVDDAPFEDRLEEGANRSLDALAGGAAAGGSALTAGGTTKLIQAVGGTQAAQTIQESRDRHPLPAAAATFVAGANPLNPGNLAARGIGSGLAAVGARIAPKLTGIVPFIGRTAAAGVAGGTAAAGEGAVTDLVENSATGSQEGTSWGAAAKRGLLGFGLGSGFHIAGEGFGAMNRATESAYEGELRDARRVGAEPGPGGVKLAPGSPAQGLEDARVAEERLSGADVAAQRVAPKIADEGARLKGEVFERHSAETGQAYDRLASGGRGRATPSEPEIADVPTLMPRPTAEETARHVETLRHDHSYVPPEQAEAVRSHAFGADDVFKRLQRGESADAIAADIQQSTGRASAGEHVARTQAQLPHLEQFMADTPPTPGTVYRGIVVDEAQAQKLMGMSEIGMDGAITGASRDPVVARSFIARRQSGEPGATHGVTFKLKHSTGRGIEDLAEQGSGYGKTGVEKEVLLPGTARFKVTGRYQDPTNPNNFIIEGEEVGGRNTMPPGPADAEASTFGRIAQEQGENQASLLGVQQAAQRGAPVTPNPVRVSTKPVVENLLGILEKHNPSGGELPFIPSDDPLRAQLPKMMRTEYVPLDEAKRRLARSGVGWIKSPSAGAALGAGEAPPDTVLLVTPRELDAPSYDIMVQALDAKAKFNKDLADGDPRYRELSAVAHKAREGFPGLNELKKGHSEELSRTDDLLTHAGVKVGAGGDVRDWQGGGANQQKAVINAVESLKQNPAGLTRDALRTIAKLGRFEDELNQIPGQVAVESLSDAMRIGKQVPRGNIGKTGLVGRALELSQLHLYPQIKALGGTPAPEKELQAMAEALSPQLKAALRAMRVSPTVKPRVQDISGLTSRIGLKGGVAGQRAAAAIEESGLTEEDVTNLKRLKQAVGAN